MLPFRRCAARKFGPENPYIRTAPVLAAMLACIFFVLAGCAFIPHLGIQNDEALFGSALYESSGLAYWRWAFGHRLPVMMMSYLGALKTWLYAPIFQIWHPAAASIRVPMLVAAAATVWLLFALLRRISPVRAARGRRFAAGHRRYVPAHLLLRLGAGCAAASSAHGRGTAPGCLRPGPAPASPGGRLLPVRPGALG